MNEFMALTWSLAAASFFFFLGPAEALFSAGAALEGFSGLMISI